MPIIEESSEIVSFSKLRDQAIELVKLTHESNSVWNTLLKLNIPALDETELPVSAGDVLTTISELLEEARRHVVQLLDKMQVRI